MVQQPSSLVFVAILLGWAVYLLPQWVRRREVLSQSRGHDRDSSGLRVLDRRRRPSAGPSTTSLLPDPRSAADSVVDPLAEVAGGRDARSVLARPTTQAGQARDLSPSPSALAARRRARVLSLLLVLTAASWAVAFVVAALGPVAWAWTGLLGLDVVALLIAGRRRE
ncbi:MAG TPA: hypothetical protein VI248_12475, partial [Kineosporiaceae bacterium]